MKTQGFGSSIGLTHAHTWGIIVPLIAAISPLWLSKLHLSDLQPVNAVFSGAVAAVVAYVAMKLFPGLADANDILARAVLVGLLIAEVMVMKPFGAIPSMTTISLWLFLWYHVVEVEH